MSIKNVVNTIKEMPEFQYIDVKIIEKKVEALVAKILSQLIHVKTRLKLVPLPKYQFAVDDYGEVSDKKISFEYDGDYYDYNISDIKYKKGQACFVITIKNYLCPLCGKKIKLEYIENKIFKGGYTNLLYKGIHQSMCFECANKIEKEE